MVYSTDSTHVYCLCVLWIVSCTVCEQPVLCGCQLLQAQSVFMLLAGPAVPVIIAFRSVRIVSLLSGEESAHNYYH